MESEEIIYGDDEPQQDQETQDSPKLIEGEVVYRDDPSSSDEVNNRVRASEKDNTGRNIIIAVVILLILICCCCFLFGTAILAVFWRELRGEFTYVIFEVAIHLSV